MGGGTTQILCSFAQKVEISSERRQRILVFCKQAITLDLCGGG